MQINRFITAQLLNHEQVIKELRKGKKTSCWMWYTFPQVKGLGYSDVSKYYEIKSRYELKRYTDNIYLSNNLKECIDTLLSLKTNNPDEIFGPIDTLKLQSSMTLFRHNRKFKYLAQKVLDKFFNGDIDYKSECIIRAMK